MINEMNMQLFFKNKIITEINVKCECKSICHCHSHSQNNMQDIYSPNMHK